MKAYQLSATTGVEALQVVERTTPQPQCGQILIKVNAVALNYRDILVASGAYPGLHLPLVPISDGAGEVVEIGPGVTQWQVGDRVAGCFFQNWQAGRLTQQHIQSALGGAIDGMLAEYVVLPETGVVAIPNHLNYVQGATLPCAALTAWQAVVVRGGLQPGETVLILGTGGVAIFALQFAKILGAQVIITSSSDEKLAKAQALGADKIINYSQHPDWEEQVWAMTDREGVDQVIEVGGAGTLEKSLRSVRVGGRVSLIGVLAGKGEFNHAHILRKSIDVQGIFVGSREMFTAMNRAIEFRQLWPSVDRVFDFAAAPAAYQYMKSGSHFGKIVITLP